MLKHIRLTISDKNTHYEKYVVLGKQNCAASLKRSKWGLGTSIHIEMQCNWINMQCIAGNMYSYTLLTLNKVLYTNHIALAIIPSWVNSWWSLLDQFRQAKAKATAKATLMI